MQRNKIQSLIIRQKANETALPFIHRKLERTSDIEKFFKKKSIFHQHRGSFESYLNNHKKSPRKLKHLPTEVSRFLFRETVHIPTKLTNSAVLGELYGNIENICNKVGLVCENAYILLERI